MVSGIIIAFVLQVFGFDEVVIQCAKELLNVEITSATYYVLFALVGFLREGF